MMRGGLPWSWVLVSAILYVDGAAAGHAIMAVGRVCAFRLWVLSLALPGDSRLFDGMKVTLEFPESAFSSLRRKPDDFAREMRLAACVKWYELGRVSQAKAAELAGLSRAEFLELLRSLGTPAAQADPSEWPRSAPASLTGHRRG